MLLTRPVINYWRNGAVLNVSGWQTEVSVASCHWGTWGTCPPQTVWRLWL